MYLFIFLIWLNFHLHGHVNGFGKTILHLNLFDFPHTKQKHLASNNKQDSSGKSLRYWVMLDPGDGAELLDQFGLSNQIQINLI